MNGNGNIRAALLALAVWGLQWSWLIVWYWKP